MSRRKTKVTDLPRLASDALTYLGAFRVPYSSAPASRPSANFSGAEAYQGGGHYAAFNPAGNGGKGSLFISGYERGSVAEITIPELVTSGVITDLQQAAFLQDFYDISEGAILADINTTGEQESMTGLALANGKLIGTISGLYGTAPNQGFTHFTHDLNLATPSFKSSKVFTPDDIGFAYLSGFMCPVPPEWQPLLGGSLLTGQMGLSVVGRTSNGMAAFAFDPSRIGSGDIRDASALVYYTIEEDKDTLGQWDDQTEVYGAVTFIRGMQIIKGTRTLLYWGRNSNEPYAYGQGTNDPALDGTEVPGYPGTHYCYDPMFPGSKGQHGYPYVFQFWAYDLNELADVKAGRKQPWEVVPYEVFPTAALPIDYIRQSGAMAYDEARGILYLAQLDVDGANGYISQAPVVHAFSIGEAPDPPDPIPPDGAKVIAAMALALKEADARLAAIETDANAIAELTAHILSLTTRQKK